MLQGREKLGKGKTSKIGFTLVELLVITTIIAILCAMAYPIMAKAKETARTSECLSNMRQIGIGLHMYLDSYDGRFPAAVPYGSPTYWKARNRNTIQELLSNYVQCGLVTRTEKGKEVYEMPGVFSCPSDKGVPEKRALFGLRSTDAAWKSTGCSYEYYASIQEDWQKSGIAVPWTSLSPLLDCGGNKIRVGAPISKIPVTTKKAVLGEIYFWHMGDRTPDDRIAYANTLFVDGHAARVKGSDYLDARIAQLDRWHGYTELPIEE